MRRAAPLLLAATLAGCASGGNVDIATLASNSDRLIWEEGRKAAEKKQWENARQYFKRIVDGFPSSELGPAARLALADSYFEEGGAGNYILAVAAYREFLTFYPSHPRADYAQFQVGESFFKQRNSPDRDQTQTQDALVEFQRLLEIYPQSAYVELGRQRIAECRQGLARAEYMVGWFYQKTRKAWRASIARYEVVLDEFPDYARLDEVLFRLAECQSFMARNAEAAPHLARLLEEFPESPYAAEARALFDAVRSSIPAAPAESAAAAQVNPSPTPTPSPPSPELK